LIRFDRDATISVYSQIAQAIYADAQDVAISPSFDNAYPDGFRDFLATLGIHAARKVQRFSTAQTEIIVFMTRGSGSSAS